MINQHHCTEYITSKIAIKQGDPASIIFYVFFLNDIIKSINTDNVYVLSLGQTKLFMLLFADDAAVFAYSPESLQNILNQIQDYCCIWCLKFNTNKTKNIILNVADTHHMTFTLMVRKLK